MSEIKLVELNNVDHWQEFIFKHPNSSPYHSLAWSQAIYEAYGHDSFYFLAYQNDCVVGVLPIISIKKPFLAPTYCALPFCDVGGCIAISGPVRDSLIDYAIQYLNITPKSPLKLREPGPYLTEKVMYEAQKVRMILPLPESSEILFSSFKSKLRSQIRKAAKNGLSYELGSSNELVEEFYGVFAYNMRSLGSPVHSKTLFLELQKSYKDKMLISIVRKGNIAIGGGIVLLGNESASIPWASTRAEYNSFAPNMMLYWSLLKEVTDRGFKEFDFGRSTFGEGTFKFKQQWGAKAQILEWSTIHSTSAYSIDELEHSSGKMRTLVENLWKKLPLIGTIFLGPKIRKFIDL